jgi:hypothetical protein
MFYNERMFSFFKPKAKYALIYDIGTSSIGAGLVRFEKNKPPQIIHTAREQMHVREKTEARRYLIVVSDALRKVSERIYKDGIADLKSMGEKNIEIYKHFFMLSAPWSASETKIAAIRKTEPFTLTESIVLDILENEEKLFEKSLSSTENKMWDEKPVVIGKEIIQTKINGYDIAKPFGKKTKEVDISFIVSVASHDIIEKIESLSSRSHRHREFRAFAFPIVVFSVLRDIFPNEEDFIFMDIAGELTDMMIVTAGIPLEHASIPCGRNTIVRQVGRGIGEAPSLAMSSVINFLKGISDPNSSKKIIEEIEKAKTVWTDNLRKVFADMSSRIAMPRKVFVMTHGEFVPLFMKALQNEMTSEWNIDGVSFSVELIDEQRLKSHVTFAKSAHLDPFVGIASAFVNKTDVKW